MSISGIRVTHMHTSITRNPIFAGHDSGPLRFLSCWVVRPGSCLIVAETALTGIILGAALWAGSHSGRSAHASIAIVLGLVGGQVFLHLVRIDRAIVDPNPAGFLRRIACSLLAGVLLAGVLLTSLPGFHDGYSGGLAAWILSLVFVVAARPILRSLIRRHRLIRTLMILGPGELTDKLSRELSTGDDVVCSVTSLPESGNIRLQQEDVSGIVVADLQMATRGTMEALIDSRMRGLRVEPAVESCERICKKIWIAGLQPEWWIYSDGFIPTGPCRALKRSIDVAGGVIITLFAAPVMILSAILIRLTSAGPIFYRQERLGQYGRPFMVLKFRSMYVDAESKSGPVWAAKNDNRITPLGRLLRKFRIDELPQLFNVLKGEMSFVGPRPERPCFMDSLRNEIPYYDVRHYVRPGITGWAQVMYPYGDSIRDAYEKLQYDLYYAKHMSLLLDMTILVKTVRVVLSGKGR
jgi:exopolysaccharide biosynthesis polyprenyl glycosylphosphotransferase